MHRHDIGRQTDSQTNHDDCCDHAEYRDVTTPTDLPQRDRPLSVWLLEPLGTSLVEVGP